MSRNNKVSQIVFPWDEVMPSTETVLLRDLDIVGVDGPRRQQLEELQNSKKIILQSYERFIPRNVRPIYDEELFRTLHWLRPAKIEECYDLNLREELRDLFSIIFPLTELSLGATAPRVRDAYLADMEWDSWLLQDHWRYFAGFLRQRFLKTPQILDLAHWEWVHTWLDVQSGREGDLELNRIVLNPSLQTVVLQEDNEILQRPAGLYSFIVSGRNNQIQEKILEQSEAFLLDLLQEERKYTAQQLLEMASLAGPEISLARTMSESAWQDKINSLLESEVLLVGGSPHFASSSAPSNDE